MLSVGESGKKKKASEGSEELFHFASRK